MEKQNKISYLCSIIIINQKIHINFLIMSLTNLGKNHEIFATKVDIETALVTLETLFVGKVTDLSAEDRQKYGSISEQNKLLVNKVADYHASQPQHSAPEVDWVEFKADNDSRQFLESIIMRISTLQRQLESTKILHDYDNYQDSLTDYAYAQYRADRNIPGATDKVNNLKQFFARTGTKNKTNDSTDTTEDTTVSAV